MANQGAKKIKASNEKVLKNLLLTILISSGLYFVVKFILGVYLFNWDWNFLHVFMLIVTSAIYGASYWWLSSAATCVYSGDELISAGSDLRVGGLLEYVFDIIYVFSFAQVVSLVSDWAWLLILAIPLYAVIKLWGSVIKPLLSSNRSMMPDGQDDGKQSKRDRKKERQTERPKYKQYRG